MVLAVDVDWWQVKKERHPTLAVVWKEAPKKEAKWREPLGQLISSELSA